MKRFKRIKPFEEYNITTCEACGVKCEPLSIEESQFGKISDDFCKKHLKVETRKLKLEKIEKNEN